MSSTSNVWISRVLPCYTFTEAFTWILGMESAMSCLCTEGFRFVMADAKSMGVNTKMVIHDWDDNWGYPHAIGKPQPQ